MPATDRDSVPREYHDLAQGEDAAGRLGVEALGGITERIRSSTPRPDAVVVSVARRRFIEEVDTRLASRSALRRREATGRRGGRGEPMLRGALAMAAPLMVIVALMVGAGRFAMQSLPDSPAYGAKLALETATRRLPASHGQRAMRALGSAERRLEELDASLRAGKSPSVLGAVLVNLEADLTAAAAEAGDMSPHDAAPSRADLIAAIGAKVVALDRRQAALAGAGISSIDSLDDEVTRLIDGLSPDPELQRDAADAPAVAASPSPTPTAAAFVVSAPATAPSPPTPTPTVAAPSPAMAGASPPTEPRGMTSAAAHPPSTSVEAAAPRQPGRPSPSPRPAHPIVASARPSRSGTSERATASPRPTFSEVRVLTPTPVASRTTGRAVAIVTATARPAGASR